MVYICEHCGQTTMREYIYEGKRLCIHCFNKFVNDAEGAVTKKLVKQVDYLSDIVKRLTQDYSNLTSKVDALTKELNNVKTELRKVNKQ